MTTEQKTSANLMPPANLEAEQSVLGAILLRAAMFDQVVDLLDPQDFYRSAHGLIYRVMIDLWNKKEPVDLVTVTSLLRERGKLDEVGGPVFLAGLSEQVGTAANAPYYARLVHQKAMLRRLLTATREITMGCLVPGRTTRRLHRRRRGQDFSDQRGATDPGGLLPGGAWSRRRGSRIEKHFREARRRYWGLPSGFTDLDKLTGGFQDGDLILMAARPSMGKTALVLNMGFHAAKVAQVPTLFFSMEQPKEQLVQRLMASAGQINAWRLRTARMEARRVDHALWDRGEIQGCPFYHHRPTGPEPLGNQGSCPAPQSKHGIGLVILDYLQLAKDPKAKSREQEVGGISRFLKALAKELNVPVIALSQLNRDLEKRPKKQPVLSDLRESGSLEQDADLVIFIYRDEVYRENSPDKGLAEIHLTKQRNGPVGKLKLVYPQGVYAVRQL